MADKNAIVSVKQIESLILTFHGQRIMLDADLAKLYGVDTRVLVQAVKRNIERFPKDFMFQLSRKDFDILRSQAVTSSQWGGRRYPPYAFTEQGVAMLSSVLRSKKAVQVNVEIMRAFVRKRKSPPLLVRHFEDDCRDCLQAQFPCGLPTRMAGDDHQVLVTQNRNIETKAVNALDDRVNRLVIQPRVVLPRRQLGQLYLADL